MLTILDSDRRALILDYCHERFGITENVFENYSWYIGSKNRIYIGPEEIERLKPESIGLCIFRLDKTPKPTTNFIQLFGKEITKNIVSLDREQTVAFCGGSSFDFNYSRRLSSIRVRKQCFENCVRFRTHRAVTKH